jgi:hypothetical protein
METEAQSGSIDENYATFIKDELFKFNELDKDAQDVKKRKIIITRILGICGRISRNRKNFRK